MFESYDYTPNHVTLSPLATTVTATNHVAALTELKDLLEKNLRHLLDICQENIEGNSSITVCEVGGVSVLKSITESVLNTNPGRPTCSYKVAVRDERQKELVEDEHAGLESFVWDVAMETISTRHDVIMTSSAVCPTEESLGNVLSSLQAGCWLIHVGWGGDQVAMGDCVASVTAGDIRVVLLRNTTPHIDESRCKFVEVSSGEFTWTEVLQSAVLDDGVDRVWLYGDEKSGTQGISNALRQEDCSPKIR